MNTYPPPYAGMPCVPPNAGPAGLIPGIQRAIEGETAARQAYVALIDVAPTDEARSNLQVILHDELKHLSMFHGLLARFARIAQPPVGWSRSPLDDYREGIRKAYYDELEAAEFYRSIVLSTRDPQVRDVFFEAMTDEVEHAIRLNRLLYLAQQERD